MKRPIVITATFLTLICSVLCYRQKRYRDWTFGVLDYHSFPDDSILKKTDTSYTEPDNDRVDPKVNLDHNPSVTHKSTDVTIEYNWQALNNICTYTVTTPTNTKLTTKSSTGHTKTFVSDYSSNVPHKRRNITFQYTWQIPNIISGVTTTMPTRTKLTTKTATEDTNTLVSDYSSGVPRKPRNITIQYTWPVPHIVSESTTTTPTRTKLTTKTLTEPTKTYFSSYYYSDRHKPENTTLDYIWQILKNLSMSTTTMPTRTKLTTKTTTEFTTKPTTTTMTQSTTEATLYTIRDFLNCIESCPATSEYNPVCGTNLVTYSNQGRLICAKRCGLAIDLLMASTCPTNTTQTFPSSQSPSTTSNRKYTTTSDILSQQQCINSCDRSLEWNPVCGSNDVTYSNVQDLMCAQYCGIGVRLKKFSACTNINPDQTIYTIPINIETFTNLESSLTLPPYIQFCIKGCPVTSEHNPVCGTNDVTYKNPSFLQCLRTCGINIQMKYRQACPQKNNPDIEQSSSVSQLQTTTAPSKSSQDICIDACNKDSEYYPVCGSNNVTYRNLERLQCAISCHVDVSLETFSSCTESSSLTEIMSSGNSEKVLTITTTKALEMSTELTFINVEIDPDVLSMIFDSPTTTEAQGGEIDPKFGIIV